MAIAAAVLAAGCGGGDEAGPTPGETVSGGPVAEGRMIFLDQGCGSCHALGAADTHGTVGPNLAVGLAGKTKQFIRESIVDPNAAVRSGYPRNTMPQDYGEKLSEGELNGLVEFLAASVTTKRKP